jgi:hypothetical protein
MTPQEQQQIAAEVRTGRGFRTNRYVLIVAIVEVFFRTNMGKRYFTFQLFFAGLVGIGLIRYWMVPFYFQLDWFDLFTFSYILLGLYHLYSQRRLSARGVVEHSWYVGSSNFRFVGRFFNSREPNYFALLYVEPLALLLLAVVIFSYSLLLAIGSVIAAIQLWYQNYRLIRRLRNEEMNRQDGMIVSEHINATTFQQQDITDSSTPPAIPRRTAPAPPPIPLPNSTQEDISPMEALERLNRKNESKE